MGRAAGLAWRWLDFLRGLRGFEWARRTNYRTDSSYSAVMHDADTLVGSYLAGQYCTIGAGEVLMDDDNILISQQPLSRIN